MSCCSFHMQLPVFSEFLDLGYLLKRFYSLLPAGTCLVRNLNHLLKELSDWTLTRCRRCFATLQHVPCVGSSIRSSFCCINPIFIFRHCRRTREIRPLFDKQPTVRDAGENPSISLWKIRLSSIIFQRKFVVRFIKHPTSLASRAWWAASRLHLFLL